MDIVDFWSGMERGSRIHWADEKIFKRISKHRHGFETNCLPACFIGDIKNAPLVLLYLSPGLSDQDSKDADSEEGKDHYARCWKGQEPIPATGWAGEKWFKSRTKRFGHYDIVRKKTAIFNIGAYHSKDVKDYASLMSLPSSRVALNWAQEVLFPEAEMGKRVVICMRSAAYWGLEVGRKYSGTLFAPKVTRAGYLEIKKKDKINHENQMLIEVVRRHIGAEI